MVVNKAIYTFYVLMYTKQADHAPGIKNKTCTGQCWFWTL